MTEAVQKTYLDHLREDRRYAAMVGLGFSSGMPFMLVYVTQSAWLSEARVPLQLIGLMSWLTFAYKLKFLWAPLLDQFDAPILSRLLGRRRGWIVASQIGVALTLAGVAFGDPGARLWWTILFSAALGVAGATQDIVIDGWRINAAPLEKQPLMGSFAEMGYRVGNLAAGAGALYLADRFGWRAAYLCMAALMAPGMISALAAPEPAIDLVAARHSERPGLAAAIWAPIKELFTRLGPLAVPVLLLIAGFRMPGYLTGAMAMPLFKSLHFSDSEIATVTKIFGFGIAMAGVFACSWLVPRIGLMSSMLLGTVAASAAHLSLAWLAGHGGEFWAFAFAVGVEAFAASFATIVLITFMSSLSKAEFAGSQYSLMTSLCAMPGFFLAGFSGLIVEKTGFVLFFQLTSLIGLPVALLCFWLWRHHREAFSLHHAPGAPMEH
ncbi:AmpG family muropeptide MFS transporter [Rhodoblastus sp.]|uniref:AmpG family muropeptide MFS transporter n=1 Tax=Rhodoblastus sp. TaxID=1962975 RepID=UPI003F95C1E2